MNKIKNITLGDKQFKPFIESDKIISKIINMSITLNKDYTNKKPLFICVLNGAFIFASELIKRFNHECEVSFVKLASYEGVESSGVVSNLIGLNEDLKDRNIIIVEDIVDTGNTISSVFEKIQAHQPKSIEVTTLLFKPKVYNKNIPIKYPVINVGNEFLVGFGLDYNGIGRNLEDIYIIEEKN